MQVCTTCPGEMSDMRMFVLARYLFWQHFEISESRHDIMKGSKWDPASLSDADKRRNPLTGQMFIN